MYKRIATFNPLFYKIFHYICNCSGELAEAAIAGSGAELVRIIGRVVLLYKPFKDKPRKIELPNPKS
jgi:RNA-binding protein YhbY